MENWSRATNVTPDNSSIYHTHVIKFVPRTANHKELFNANYHSTYAKLDQTWENQKPYTSG